jgi:hypothetical protein
LLEHQFVLTQESCLQNVRIRCTGCGQIPVRLFGHSAHADLMENGFTPPRRYIRAACTSATERVSCTASTPILEKSSGANAQTAMKTLPCAFNPDWGMRHFGRTLMGGGEMRKDWNRMQMSAVGLIFAGVALYFIYALIFK